MRTYTLAYDKIPAQEGGQEIDSNILLTEILEFLVKEGAETIYHSLASTLVFTCDNRFVYGHWQLALAESSIPRRAFYVFAEVYQGTTRHFYSAPSNTVDHEAFQILVTDVKLRIPQVLASRVP